VPGLAWRVPGNVDGVADDRADDFQGLPYSRRAAGQVYDEAAGTHARDGSAEHGHSRLRRRSCTDGFGDAGDFVLNDRPGGLRRDVSGAQACATGGQDDVDIASVAPGNELTGDLVSFVWDQSPVNFDVTEPQHDLRYGRARGVLPFPPGTCVADGQYGELAGVARL